MPIGWSQGAFGRVVSRSPVDGCPAVQKRTNEQCANELFFLTQLRNHPNIVRVFAHACSPGVLVLEACKTSLEDILEARQTFNLQELASCTLAALAYMHGQYIAHNDIKPPNILCGQTWKICDFGNAVSMPLDHLCIPDRGYTQAYAAPELVLAADLRAKINVAKADMWSFGVTMLHAACENNNREDLFEHVSGVVILHLFNIYDIQTATTLPSIQPFLQLLEAKVPDLALHMSELLCVYADERCDAHTLVKN